MKNKNILFIYAHMDDEAILSYGTLAKLTKNNNILLVTLCGNGRENDYKKTRAKQYCQILRKLNINHISLTENDLSLDKNKISNYLNNCILSFKPDIVFTHSQKDLHFEHRLTAEQVLLNCRNIPNSTVKSLYTTVSPTYNWTYGQYGNFQPNIFIDISEYAKEKKEALKLYDMELPENQLDNRSVDSIMIWDKMYGHTIGVEYAEPYEQIFSII
jgi:LmbE family N-acetylglucosaminyl deacetylase